MKTALHCLRKFYFGYTDCEPQRELLEQIRNIQLPYPQDKSLFPFFFMDFTYSVLSLSVFPSIFVSVSCSFSISLWTLLLQLESLSLSCIHNLSIFHSLSPFLFFSFWSSCSKYPFQHSSLYFHEKYHFVYLSPFFLSLSGVKDPFFSVK